MPYRHKIKQVKGNQVYLRKLLAASERRGFVDAFEQKFEA